MLDTYDLAILKALGCDASLTNAQLSGEVHLSPSQCSRRRMGLEKAGIIRGYRADIDHRKLGLGIETITRVTLSAQGDTSAGDFETAIGRLDEVVEASAVTGDADYVLRIRTSSLDALAEFIHTRLLPISSVSQVRSDIVLKRLKDKGMAGLATP